jgi:hypothetical protein
VYRSRASREVARQSLTQSGLFADHSRLNAKSLRRMSSPKYFCSQTGSPRFRKKEVRRWISLASCCEDGRRRQSGVSAFWGH